MGIFRQFPYSNFHEMNMDQIIKIMREMQDEWAETKTEWTSYKDFIDNYFANLDVSEEVMAALRTLAATGELNQIIDPTIATETAAWLAEHITPTSPAVDSSLSIAGAAADAKATGDTINNLKDTLSVGTKNLFDPFGDINRKRTGDTETYTELNNTVNSDGSIVVNASAARSYGIGQRITLPVGQVAISGHIDSVGNGNWVTTRLYKVAETPTLIGEATSRGGDIAIKANIEEAGVYLVGWYVNGGTPPCGAKVSNIQVEINDYVTSYIPNRITTPYYTNIKYPKLNGAQKAAIVALCQDYYNHRDVFTYDYGIFRNAYVDKAGCYDNNKNKYKLNCSAFAQFILMGRKATDFYELVNDNPVPINDYGPEITNASGYDDIGYYFNFKYRPVGFFDQSYYEYYDTDNNLIFGDISLDYHTAHPDRPIYKVTSKYFYVFDELGNRVVLDPAEITPRLDENGNQYRRYRGYENLDQREDDVGAFTWYSYFTAARPAYVHHQQINNFMNANDMALELYEMGCEIPYSELDVGDIVFFKSHNRSEERSDFATWAYRYITHVALVIGFQNMTLNDGTTQKQPIFIECTGTMQQVIVETSNAFPGEIDRMRAESLHHNIVMCARNPIAFGYSPNVPSEITSIPATE